MQCTADFHDPFADAHLRQVAGVADDAAVLDTAVDMLDVHATTCDAPIRSFLRRPEGAASRLPGRHNERQETEPWRNRLPAGRWTLFVDSCGE